MCGTDSAREIASAKLVQICPVSSELTRGRLCAPRTRPQRCVDPPDVSPVRDPRVTPEVVSEMSVRWHDCRNKQLFVLQTADLIPVQCFHRPVKSFRVCANFN